MVPTPILPELPKLPKLPKLKDTSQDPATLLKAGTKVAPILKIQDSGEKTSEEISTHDLLAVEEPLEIRLGYRKTPNSKSTDRVTRSISITMRTPGHDFDLAIGFLFTEGIIRSKQEIQDISHCRASTFNSQSNVVRVELDSKTEVDLSRLERHFYTSSSCGVCGKASIDALRVESAFQSNHPRSLKGPFFSAHLIHDFPEKIRKAQGLFESTGGLHASALFSQEGELISIREDVGRHNALDKVIGAALLQDKLPLCENALVVSGRASFELVQKASIAGIPVLIAVGAPSSLAVELAQETGMTLLGFTRNHRFNIYHGAERILLNGDLEK